MAQILKQIEVFEENLVSRCMKQILRALNYLHNQGTGWTIGGWRGGGGQQRRGGEEGRKEGRRREGRRVGRSRGGKKEERKGGRGEGEGDARNIINNFKA
jgi:hypothetical protein